MIGMIENSNQALTNYIAANHQTKYALIGGGLCAVAAAELGLRVLHNLWQVASNDPRRDPDGNFGHTVSRNLGGMILFGACASNAIPGLAAAGAIVLIVNALFGKDSEDALVLTKGIRVLKPVAEELSKTAWNITKELASATWNLVSAVCETIGNIVKAVLDTIYAILRPIGSLLGNVFLTVIPKTPEAIAAVAVLGAILIYKRCIQ